MEFLTNNIAPIMFAGLIVFLLMGFPVAADGTISGGMIPKVETCIDAVERGVRAAVILDGRIQHVLLIELFTEHGAGTMISRD